MNLHMVSSVKETSRSVLNIVLLALFLLVALVGCSNSYLNEKEKATRIDNIYELRPGGILYHKNSASEWVVGPDQGTSFIQAKNWADNLEIDGGGWRLPTGFEIKALYNIGEGTRNMSPYLKTSGWHVWISASDDLYDYYFSFIAGRVIRSDRSPYIHKSNDLKRGFAVRLRLDKKYADLEHKYKYLLKTVSAGELNLRGIELSKSGDLYGGIWFYEKAIEKDPRCYDAFFNRGKTYSMQGNYEKALTDFDNAIKSKASFSLAYAYRGLILSALSNNSEAILSLNKAIRIDPVNGALYYHRAQHYYKLGKYKSAWADVKKAQSLNYVVRKSFIRALNVHLDLDE